MAPAQSRRVSTVPFKLKYGYFRELLQANDQVLEFIADLEDILAGKLVLDPPVVRSRLDKAALTTFVMVKNLNLISDGRYPGLYTALERIHGAVERELAAGDWAHHNELVVPLERAVRHARSALGGKMANLGEVKNRAGLRVPDGFVITTAAFERLLSHDGLGPSITARLRGTGDNLVRLAVASQEIQNMLRRAELPGDLRDAITGATMVLAERSGSRARFAVRSSGVGEDDARSSFAGQYETLLNVAADDVPAAYLTVVASLYQPSALLYRRERGLREEDPGMAVGVMELVDAACAGVMFSRDPARPSERRILVDAVPGQGVGAVDGTVAPDAFVLGPGNEILECSVTEKQRAQMAVPEGGLAAVELPQQDRTLPCIDATHLGELAHIARVLEDHFGGPQDIEWALDQNHKIYVLQSRPLVVREVSPVEPLEPGGGHEPLLREGTCACPGVGAGTVFRIESEADIGNVPDGAVLVARHSSPRFVRVMGRVHAIVTSVGGATGHMSILAREFGTPAIVGAPGACTLLPGTEVTVDASRATVWAGRVADLLDAAQPGAATTRQGASPMVECISPYVCPLRLIDPASEDFRPERCRSIHDVTRFVHEKTFAEMFHIGDDVKNSDEAAAVKLRARLPIDIYIFDLGGALRSEAAGRDVQLTDVESVPLRAFIMGLNDPAIRWDRPRPVSLGGFLSVLGESMVGPPPSKHGLGRRSFAMASDTYLNFSTRAGYHFSTVDTYCGRSINKNYVQLRFSGGAAAKDRRVRRVRFVAKVMTRLGFDVKTRGDLMAARLAKYPREDIESTLRRLGQLTVCTRQLDMLMDSDDHVEAFTDAFFAGDFERFA